MNANSPEISIIISAYNCEHLVGEAIQSILNQTHENWEIVIADDGSTDQTKNKINSFDDPRIRKFHNEKNLGLLNTWNKLIPLTRGRYITWQDADDISYPERLEILRDALENHPSVSVCGSNFKRPFAKWNTEIQSNFPTTNSEIKNYIKINRDLPFCGLRLLFKREVVIEFDGLKTFYNKLGWEDFDLLLRISEKYEMMNVPQALYEYRYYPNSASKFDLNNIDYRKVYISEIGFFFQNQRMKYGADALTDDAYLKELEEFLLQKKLEFEQNRFLVLEKIIRNKTANKDFNGAFSVLKSTITFIPFALKVKFSILIFIRQMKSAIKKSIGK